MLDAGAVGNAIEQRGDVANIADGWQLLAALQFVDERDQVDRPGRLGQIDHPRVNAAVRVEREIFRVQVLGGLVVREVVEENCAEDGALGFYVRRQSADAVIGGRQNRAVPVFRARREFFSLNRIELYPRSALWMRSVRFGKLRPLTKFLAAELHDWLISQKQSYDDPSVGEEKSKINSIRLRWGAACREGGDALETADKMAPLQKQMRSGPATRTALFWRNVPLPFHARGVEELTAGMRPEERSPVMPPGRSSWRSKLRRPICGTTVADGKSGLVFATLLGGRNAQATMHAPKR